MKFPPMLRYGSPRDLELTRLDEERCDRFWKMILEMAAIPSRRKDMRRSEVSNATKCSVCNKTLSDGDFCDDLRCPNPVPTADAAEGECSTVVEDIQIAKWLSIIMIGDDKDSKGYITKAHHLMALMLSAGAEIAAIVTPKPAPDAMREALIRAQDVIRRYFRQERPATLRTSANQVLHEIKAALSTPVPSPDRQISTLHKFVASQQDIDPEVRDQICGMIAGLSVAVPSPNWTSGRDAGLAEAMFGISSSATGAAEPDMKCSYCNGTGKTELTTAERNALSDLEMQDALSRATPPVRGDREEGIAWRRVNDEPFEYAIQQGQHGDEFVKLLNGSWLRRPVQPGAGERPKNEAILAQCDELHELGFNDGWNGAVEESAKIARDEADIWIKGEATTAIGQAFQRACRQISLKISALSRQAPQSSSDGERR